MMGREIAVGPGKADLLARLQETGSISGAARALGMSYKRAWYLIDTMNRCFHAPLVEAVKGGRAHGGASLTPVGIEVLGLYRSLEAKALQAGADELAALTALAAKPPAA
jgi:molybdate transport system regulatory protein